LKAFPLQWPTWKPRRLPAQRKSANFGKSESRGNWNAKVSLTVRDSIMRLQRQCDTLGARYVVISTNVEPRLDGLPRSDRSEPSDPGVALYFDLSGKPHCMPCDTFDRVADNIAAIAGHIEAQRKIERYGVVSLAEAFSGFMSLPAPETGPVKRPWRTVLGFKSTFPNDALDESMIDFMFKQAAKKAHPDTGGTDEAMAEVNAAREEALEAMKNA
jgi:hypothetical protein